MEVVVTGRHCELSDRFRSHAELTAFSKGPVIRAEAAADHEMGALDHALDKMAEQMRRASDRR
ncbi:HPF/RaiA family ribosome-associated protein, partial [Streptomyces rhizosphaericus]|uniref:HPF/RaiA family ribosome-associated protein n=1 Tax=Streptomyces rhizosphaericus TaxID=114699 RepID=UPI0031E173B6